MKSLVEKKSLSVEATALLTNAGIISTLIQGLQENFSNLSEKPRFVQVTDIILQDHLIKLTYVYAFNKTEISACLSLVAGIWLSGQGPLTSEQMKVLKSLARPVND